MKQNWTGWEPGDNEPTVVDPWFDKPGSATNPHIVNTVWIQQPVTIDAGLVEEMNSASIAIAEKYADWSDEHHRICADVSKNVGFYTVDEEDLEHLE